MAQGAEAVAAHMAQLTAALEAALEEKEAALLEDLLREQVQ